MSGDGARDGKSPTTVPRGGRRPRAVYPPSVFALGHLGLGKKIAARSYRGFSPDEKRAFFLGALLPDLIDKPLFYVPHWLAAGRGGAAGLLSGTHLFAHTGLFLLGLVLAARI